MAASGLSSRERAIEELKDECTQLWNKTKEQYAALQKPGGTSTGGTDKALLSVSLEKEKRLKAEIEHFKTCKPPALPSDPDTLKSLIKRQLQEGNQHLQEVLTHIQLERKELEQQIESEKAMLEQQRRMQALLEKRLEEPDRDNPEEEARLMKEQKKKQSSLSVYRRDLMKEIASVVQMHFAAPTEEEVNKWRKTRSSNQTKAPAEYVPLQDMLEDLMNKCVDTPHDAYLSLGDNHWPPYVELMLRTGICVRHPQDDRRIKLAPHHL